MGKKVNDGKCPICGNMVTILDGPESYVYKDYKFYHNTCIRAQKTKGNKG